MSYSRITISLPEGTLARAERERRSTGESRSELFRRALEALFEADRREAAIRSYVESYVAEPETDTQDDQATDGLQYDLHVSPSLVDPDLSPVVEESLASRPQI